MLRFIPFITLLMCLYLLGQMSFDWSYTDTMFGGHLGFVLPPVLGLVCYVVGRWEALS